jgi:gamma-glutamyltranspeptidase
MITLLAFVAFYQSNQLPPVRDPAYARDGRLAVSIEGDLWLREASGQTWTRLTNGPAWDRQPAWGPDGNSLVFVSDRGGNTDLWRVTLSSAAGAGIPERVTTDSAPEGEPSVSRDGAIAFVRGRGAAARIWLRAPDGSERRMSRSDLPERWPSFSPDGQRLAYVQQAEAGRRLRVRAMTGDADSIAVSDRAPESPAWSLDGGRIVFYSATPRPAIYVTPTDGRYVNVASTQRGWAVWIPDGSSLLIAERPPDDAGYNGDPARIADRAASESFQPTDRQLVTVQAPVAPDESPATVTVGVTLDRAARNAEAFDRLWERVDRVYFSAADASQGRARWQALRDAHRPRALAARDDTELERALHALLRERPTLRNEASGRAAVSSAHPVATEAGLEILRKGGNVVDAAVAVSFALGVVEPDASGIGGYGEMLVHMKGMERPALIEFMARVPEEATLSNAALQDGGRYPPDGPLLAMIPGTVSGMHTAWRRYGSGKVPWAELVAPAIRAARDGYVVSDGLATTLMLERESFAKYESSRALFFRDGKPLTAGDTIRNPDLAWTLEQIARGGADGFYRGVVAQRMVGDLRGKGNAIRLTDLARYFAADREPMSTTYRGHTVYGSAPPASGGATLVAQLNLLEQFTSPKVYTEDAATLHAMIAAWQLVPSGRGRMGDPSLWPVNTEAYSSKDTAKVRWRCFTPEKALTPATIGNVARCDSANRAASGSELSLAGDQQCDSESHATNAVCRANGTTAFAVADAEGNAVSVTQTLGTWGGNFYVSPGLGFLYNDKLTSYGTDPNSYGARLPYARHGSTLSPAIVFRGNGAGRRPVLAVGAAGNAWITSAVYQTLVGVLDFGLSPQRALELPRFLPGGRGGGPGEGTVSVTIEDGMSPDVIAKLASMGYRFNPVSLKGELRMGYGAAVLISDGRVTAGGDPRRSGAAGAVK